MHRIADNGSNVVSNPCFAKARVETLNHASLHIDAKQAPGRADGAACFGRVVSGSWPEFEDCLSRCQWKCRSVLRAGMKTERSGFKRSPARSAGNALGLRLSAR
jgi:hypothetical protein